MQGIINEVITFLKLLPALVSVVVLLISAIGIVKSKNILQTMHFVTIIDAVCVPLAIFLYILFTGFDNIRMLVCLVAIATVSPVSSYFIGKHYITKKSEEELAHEQELKDSATQTITKENLETSAPTPVNNGE